MKYIVLALLLLVGLASAIEYQVPDTYVDGSLNVKNTAALNATTATTIQATTITATGKFVGNINTPDYFSIGLGRVVDSNYTYPTGGKMDSIVLVDARSDNSTITLLPAAEAPGNLTIIKAEYLPGANYIRINVTGGEHINGADYLKTTDDAGVFMPATTLWSSGAAWYVVNALGTWTSSNV